MARPRGVKARGVVGCVGGCSAANATRHCCAADKDAVSGGVGKGKCDTCSAVQIDADRMDFGGA